MRIYFAGPLFTPYERSYIDECAAIMRAVGMEVFVPHEIPLPESVTPEFIFDVDSKQVMRADAVLALLDGPMVDDGTASEIGIFWAAMQYDKSKKGIVGLVTDTRVIRDRNMIDGKGINLFVRGCIEDVGEVVDHFDKAFVILQQWQKELADKPD
ncbi:MAG: nucleoside 2-deoxyribosyltransferase [Actinobacteria bacterium]|nr:nucleoside 2-deoxyribosyltransferase [Actinomycetota bacterium]